MFKRFGFCGLFAIVFCLAVPGVARATSFTYLIGYQLQNTDPYLLNPGPWGTVTISDSLDDPERVEIDIVANLPNFPGGKNFTTLDTPGIYLNLQPPAGVTFPNAFRLLPQGTPDITGTVAGTIIPATSVSYNPNTKTPAGTSVYLFDMVLGSGIFPYNQLHASMSLQSPGNPQINLDASMFNVAAPCVTSTTYGQVCLYAAVQGHYTGGQPDTSFGATPVPEPATLILLGTGLALAGRRLRRRSV